MGYSPIFAAHPDFFGTEWNGLPDSIRVVQLFLVQFVLVRIQVGQLNYSAKALYHFWYKAFCFSIPLLPVISPATENNIKILVTRNLKDYKTAEISVMTAEQYLKGKNKTCSAVAGVQKIVKYRAATLYFKRI